MFAKNSNRTAAFFAADFEPVPSRFGDYLDAIGKVPDSSFLTDWAVAEAYSHVFRDPKKKQIFGITLSRVFAIAIGYDNSQTFFEAALKKADPFLEHIGVKTLKRAGQKLMASIPLKGMNHAEMTELFRTTFLTDSISLDGIVANSLEDVHLNYWTQYGTSKVHVVITPQSPDQVPAYFRANLEGQVQNLLADRVTDTSMADFLNSLRQDALMVDLDFSRNDIRTDQLQAFLTTTSEGAERIADAIVRKLTH